VRGGRIGTGNENGSLSLTVLISSGDFCLNVYVSIYISNTSSENAYYTTASIDMDPNYNYSAPTRT
jgi:hypothetical protein